MNERDMYSRQVERMMLNANVLRDQRRTEHALNMVLLCAFALVVIVAVWVLG